jgi:DNA polymerase III alpha subunit
MRSNKYGEIILNSNDAFNALYSGKILDFASIAFENGNDLKRFNQAIEENFESFSKLKGYLENHEDISTFDNKNQNSWFMPEKYKNMDIEEFLVNQCPEENYDRLVEELALFRQHNMMDLLKYLKYLVDAMRENKIVWGVGRGSSVASYALYLIGVHKVDSIKYQLDINEFLK